MIKPRQLSTREQIHFARGLSFLIGAGVPLLESLELLATQATSRSSQRWLKQVTDQVANGQSLHRSLTHSRRSFGPMSLNLIRVGEESGLLRQNLTYLATELQKRQLLQRKIISALIYPAFIAFATIALVVALTIFIFPKITPIFRGLRLTLPWSTRLMMAVSQFLRQDGWWLLAGVITLVLLFLVVRRYSPTGQRVLAWLNLRWPVAGPLTLNYQLATLCRTLGLLLQSGLSLGDALRLTAETTPHPLYRTHVQAASSSLWRGEKISTYFVSQPRYFPPLLTNLVVIGEKTSALADTLLHLAELYEQEIEQLTKNLSSVIEPVLMIVMGGLVSLVAISVITPIYEITQNLPVH